MKIIFFDKSKFSFNAEILFKLMEEAGESITSESDEADLNNQNGIYFKKLFKICKNKSIPISLIFSEQSTVDSHLGIYKNKMQEKFPVSRGSVFFGTRGNTSKDNNIIIKRKMLIKYITYKQEYLFKNGSNGENQLLGRLEGVSSAGIITIAKEVSEVLNIEEWKKQKGNKEEKLKILIKNLAKLQIFISESSANTYMPEKLKDEDVYSGFVLIDSYYPWIFINSKEYVSNTTSSTFILEPFGRQILTIIYLTVYILFFSKKESRCLIGSEKIYDISISVLVSDDILKPLNSREIDINVLNKVSRQCRVTQSLVLEAVKKYFGKDLVNYDSLRQQILDNRQKAKRELKSPLRAKPVPSYFKLNGFGFVDFVLGRFNNGKITESTASNLLFKRSAKRKKYLLGMNEKLRSY
jgi:hypothetical protein